RGPTPPRRSGHGGLHPLQRGFKYLKFQGLNAGVNHALPEVSWPQPFSLGPRPAIGGMTMARRFGHHSSLGAWGFALLGTLVAPQLGCGESKEDPSSESVSQIVYAVRQHTVGDGDNVEVNVSGGMGQVMDYKRYVPGARLELLN